MGPLVGAWWGRAFWDGGDFCKIREKLKTFLRAFPGTFTDRKESLKVHSPWMGLLPLKNRCRRAVGSKKII